MDCVRVNVAVVMWLTLAGCLGEGRPLDDYVRDEENRRARAAGDGGILDGGGDAFVSDDAFVGPVVEPVACSMAGDAVTLTFLNHSLRDVQVLWVSQACAELPYRTLGPGESYQQPTFTEHVWRLRDAVNNRLLYEFPGSAAAGTTEVVYP